MILPPSPSSMSILKWGSSHLWGRMCDIDVEGAKSKKGNAIVETNCFSHIFFEFLVFVAIVGKISSSASQSRKKNSKIHWCGLFLAGRKCPGYLARARARALARPSCSTGASGPFDDRRLRSTTFRARATFKKAGVSLNFPLAMIVSWALARLFVSRVVCVCCVCCVCCCRVTPYRGENLSLFPHTFETRTSREIA